MKNILISIFLLLAVQYSFAQKTIELSNWKFQTGDKPEWAKPALDDTDWQPIIVGQYLSFQGNKDYTGYGWYRVKFKLPSAIKREALIDSLLFELGKIDDCDQTFLNGELLGQNTLTIAPGKFDLADLSKTGGVWNITRKYHLKTDDPRLKWDAENVLAIRVFDYTHGGGIYSLPVNVRILGLADCIAIDTDAKELEIKAGGMMSKTVILKNTSSLPVISGKLTMTVKVGSKSTKASRTWDVQLDRDEKSFTLDFEGDFSQQTTISYIFTESKTKSRLVLSKELPYLPAIVTGNIPLKENAVSFTNVKVSDTFWSPRIETNRTVTLPHIFRMCELYDYFNVLDKAKKGITGVDYGKKHFAAESDLYKTIEAVAYSLRLKPDTRLEAYADSLIDAIVSVQQPDGYLNWYFTVTDLTKKWENDYFHESYCAGHLIEAGVAWYEATGKRKLLDASIRLADNMDATFGAGKKAMAPQHPEIELALVKLHKVTGNDKYLKLAQYFIDARGNHEGRQQWYMTDTPSPFDKYALDDIPVRDLSTAEGHAVRALYLYCGMADLAIATGDKTLLAPLGKIWDDLVYSRMYITGGSGIIYNGESFNPPYCLFNDELSNEGCEAISLVLFAQRMSQLHSDARYMDIAEQVLYNRVAAETSLDGNKFFYGYPLCNQSTKDYFGLAQLPGSASNERTTCRSYWFDCACCPPNIARFLPTIGGYAYAQGANTVFVNLYIGGTANLTRNGAKLTLEQTGNYPWEGNIKIAVNPEKATKFDLALRIPSWCETISYKVNGKQVSAKTDKGYAYIDRTWQARDVVEIDMPMPVKRIYADPRVYANRGRVALQRGPLVYCLEGIDHNGKVLDIMLPGNAKLTTEKRPDLLGGVTVITGTAKRVKDGQPAEDVKITAIPHYVWDNRPPSGEMIVWIPESPEGIGK